MMKNINWPSYEQCRPWRYRAKGTEGGGESCEQIKRLYQAIGFSRFIIMAFLAGLVLLTFTLHLDSGTIVSTYWSVSD